MAKSRKDIRDDYMRRHRAQGLCLMCSNQARQGRSRCQTCEDRRTELDAKRRLKAIREGMCYECRKAEAMSWHKLCALCYCQSVSANRLNVNTKRSGQCLLDKFHGQGGRCAISGAEMILGKDCDLDHVIPTSRGGANTIENTQWVLSACNRMKDNLLEENEFLPLIEKIYFAMREKYDLIG